MAVKRWRFRLDCFILQPGCSPAGLFFHKRLPLCTPSKVVRSNSDEVRFQQKAAAIWRHTTCARTRPGGEAAPNKHLASSMQLRKGAFRVQSGCERARSGSVPVARAQPIAPVQFRSNELRIRTHSTRPASDCERAPIISDARSCRPTRCWTRPCPLYVPRLSQKR